MTNMFMKAFEENERLGSLADVDEVVQNLARLLKKLVNIRWTAVYFFDRNRRDFSPARSHGLPRRFQSLFREMPLAPESIPLLKKILSRKQHLQVTDPASSELLTPSFRKLLKNFVLLTVPMVARGQVLGAVFVARSRDYPPFSDEETAVIRDMVSHAALIVSHMQLFDESLDMALDLAGRIDVIFTLDEINKALSSSLSREKIMDTAMGHIERITQCEMVAILQVEGNELVVTAAHGRGVEIPSTLQRGTHLTVARCVACDAYRRGVSTHVADLERLKKLNPLDGAIRESGIRSLLAIPLMIKETVKGVLLLGDTKKGKFAKGESFTIEKIASQMAVALENARLYEDMRSLFINTISSLANAIDAKSPWTKGHSERVMQIAARIAKELGLPEEVVERVRLGGLLHDIGKIGIIEALLERPEKLSEDEFPPLRLHPEKGVAILSPIEQLSDVLPAILHHHERYDGTGYPKGLKGEEIPLIARIVTVADAFDAMVADRPYKKGYSVPEALIELRECIGTHFDPKVVECFCRYVERAMDRGESPELEKALRKGQRE